MLDLTSAGGSAGALPAKKKPVRKHRAGFYFKYSGMRRVGSGGLNIRCLFAFGTLGHFERDLLSFLESLETSHLNRGKMREQIFTAVVRGNKPIPFCVIEPFHSSCCHIAVPLDLKNYRKKFPETV